MSHRQSSLDNSRRHFLRGVGVALALPWLESLPCGRALAEAAAGAKGRPAPAAAAVRRRVYFSNGVEPAHWWAKGAGASMEIGPGLKPMVPSARTWSSSSGLFNEQAARHKSPHLGRMPTCSRARGSAPSRTRSASASRWTRSSRNAIGDQTAVPSLVLGIEPTELRLEDGLSMIYGSCISWVVATKPATKEIYPVRVFDLLVGDGTGRRARSQHPRRGARRSAASLSRRSAAPTATSSTIPRIDPRHRAAHRRGAGNDGRLEGWRPSLDKPDMPRPADELPQNVPDHMKLMLDLIVLAFQMDKTRIATLMLNNDLSQMNFRFLEGVQGACTWT